MSINSSPSSPFSLDSSLYDDLKMISQSFPNDGEDLVVEKGALKIIQKGHFHNIRAIFSSAFFLEDSSHSEVAQHLESLAQQTVAAFDAFTKKSFEWEKHSIYSLKVYKRLIKDVTSKISDLQYSYRGVSPNEAKRIFEIYVTFANLKKTLKKNLQNSSIPSIVIEPRPLEYDLPLRRRKPLKKMPRGATPQNIVMLFQNTQSYGDSPVLETYVRVLLKTHYITDEHVDAFCTLSKKITFNTIILVPITFFDKNV